MMAKGNLGVKFTQENDGAPMMAALTLTGEDGSVYYQGEPVQVQKEYTLSYGLIEVEADLQADQSYQASGQHPVATPVRSDTSRASATGSRMTPGQARKS